MFPSSPIWAQRERDEADHEVVRDVKELMDKNGLTSEDVRGLTLVAKDKRGPRKRRKRNDGSDAGDDVSEPTSNITDFNFPSSRLQPVRAGFDPPDRCQQTTRLRPSHGCEEIL